MKHKFYHAMSSYIQYWIINEWPVFLIPNIKFPSKFKSKPELCSQSNSVYYSVYNLEFAKGKMFFSEDPRNIPDSRYLHRISRSKFTIYKIEILNKID